MNVSTLRGLKTKHFSIVPFSTFCFWGEHFLKPEIIPSGVIKVLSFQLQWWFRVGDSHSKTPSIMANSKSCGLERFIPIIIAHTEIRISLLLLPLEGDTGTVWGRHYIPQYVFQTFKPLFVGVAHEKLSQNDCKLLIHSYEWNAFRWNWRDFWSESIV